MSFTRNIKAIIFDLDDLLVSTGEANAKAYEAACREIGVSFDRKTLDQSRGLTWRESIPVFSGAKDTNIVEKIHDRKAELYEDHLIHAKPIAPMVDLVSALHGRLRLCVATAASNRCARRVLARFALLEKFEFIVTSEDVDEGKPSPSLFLEAARRFDLKPSECLVVEDSENGVKAALKAGMTCLRLVGYETEV